MVIKKGEPWGHAAERPANTPLAETDAAAAALLVGGAELISLAAGDLLSTIGGTAEGERSDVAAAQHLPVDLGWVTLDNHARRPFIAHVVARRPFWRGEGAVVMNAAWVGDLYLGPRAHPNDGLLDITSGALPFRQLMQARNRARTGSHLPHPALTVVRAKTWTHQFSRPVSVWIDDVFAGTASTVSVELDPDAGVIVI